MKKVVVRIQFGSRSCLEDGGGMVGEYECSSEKDAETLLKAVDDAMGFEDYQIFQDEEELVS